jgi:hypothetical protein
VLVHTGDQAQPLYLDEEILPMSSSDYYQRNKVTLAAKQKERLANRTPEQRAADKAYHVAYYLQAREKEGKPLHVRATQEQERLADPLHKRCTKCKERKPLAAFGNSKRTKDGKQFQCLECKRKDWQDYAEHRQDKAARKVYYEDYAEENRPEIATRMKTYDAMRLANGLREHQQFPERTRARSKAYYDAHPQEMQQYREMHGDKRREQNKLWHAAHPEYNALKIERRRARKQNLPDTWTAEQVDFMLDYWGHSCAACGNPKGLFWTLAYDHFIPLASPDCPGTIATNMIPLCHGRSSCNNSKRSSEAHAWLLRRFGPKKAAKIEKAIATYFAQVALVFTDQPSRL